MLPVQSMIYKFIFTNYEFFQITRHIIPKYYYHTTQPKHKVIVVQPQHEKEFNNLISKSFDDDPLITWLSKNPEKRRKILYAQNNFCIKATGHEINLAVVNENGKLCSGVNCIPPGTTWSSWTTLRFRINGFMVGGFEWLTKILELNRKMTPIQEAVMGNTPYYYLLAVATLPEERGKGYGSSVLKPILEKADRERVCCYLESSNPNMNTKFYERLGFKTNTELKMDDNTVIAFMRRDPQI